MEEQLEKLCKLFWLPSGEVGRLVLFSDATEGRLCALILISQCQRIQRLDGFQATPKSLSLYFRSTGISSWLLTLLSQSIIRQARAHKEHGGWGT